MRKGRPANIFLKEELGHEQANHINCAEFGYANGMSFSVGYEAVTEPETPQTGDSSMMVLWIALFVVSGAGATAIYSRKRKSSAK